MDNKNFRIVKLMKTELTQIALIDDHIFPSYVENETQLQM